jgi:hypothetical protein
VVTVSEVIVTEDVFAMVTTETVYAIDVRVVVEMKVLEAVELLLLKLIVVTLILAQLGRNVVTVETGATTKRPIELAVQPSVKKTSLPEVATPYGQELPPPISQEEPIPVNGSRLSILLHWDTAK